MRPPARALHGASTRWRRPAPVLRQRDGTSGDKNRSAEPTKGAHPVPCERNECGERIPWRGVGRCRLGNRWATRCLGRRPRPTTTRTSRWAAASGNSMRSIERERFLRRSRSELRSSTEGGGHPAPERPGFELHIPGCRGARPSRRLRSDPERVIDSGSPMDVSPERKVNVRETDINPSSTNAEHDNVVAADVARFRVPAVADDPR